MHIHTAQTWIEREGLMVYVQTPHLQVRKSQVLLFIPSHQKRCSVRWKHTVKSSRWRWTSKKWSTRYRQHSAYKLRRKKKLENPGRWGVFAALLAPLKKWSSLQWLYTFLSWRRANGHIPRMKKLCCRPEWFASHRHHVDKPGICIKIPWEKQTSVTMARK